ncbi:MAG: alkaline phosphatase family protein [Gemmatimonadaceae bacterium]
MNADTSVIVVLADGARPDVLSAALDAGELPALARLRAEGGLYSVATVFPSVTGPAYTPFLMGQHPGSVGLPGLRWYDRARSACSWPSYARSYTGPQCRFLDRDLAADAATMFELTESSIGALSVIRRGLPRSKQIGRGAAFVARTAITHFRGDVAGWLDTDRRIGDTFVQRVRDERPAYAFAALTGIDKASHARGHDAPIVHDAMRIVDDVCRRLRSDAEQAGRWHGVHLWVVSDHGHSPVAAHEDLAGLVGSLGFRVVAHPWIVRRGAQVAVAVSGNSMAHIYTGLKQRTRQFWPALSAEWSDMAATILERDSVDIMLLPRSDTSCEVHARGCGHALVTWDEWEFAYRPITGDPLGVGELASMDAADAFDATIDSGYPDGVVQIARIAACARSGDIVLSAAPGWDFRARYEPIKHVSSHGALHREHMLVPLLTNRPVAHEPRRTVDVMASACAVLGLRGVNLEGTPFVDSEPETSNLRESPRHAIAHI